jgi:hypothetical protein
MFEVYIVAVNYNNSGQDKVLGNFSWGYNDSGLTPIGGSQINFNSGTSISPFAQEIISHDFPNYSFYGH